MPDDHTLIYTALNIWANYIETGDVAMSAIDAERSKYPVKALTIDQMKTVIRLRELASEILAAKK